MSLRQRNRHNAMRLVQRTALDLFIEQGFDAVTVEEIANQVGMAPSTLYRHFSTKESIVLWDEHDQSIDDAFARELGQQAPWAALKALFVTELGGRYDEDRVFQLRRVRYIYSTEDLHAAAIEADFSDRSELQQGLTHVLPRNRQHAAPVLAGAAMLALDIALDRWQQAQGTESLGTLIGDAFDMLANLDELA